MKLYPCQKIALALIDYESQMTKSGFILLTVRCKAADRGAADMIFPAEDTAGQRLKLLEKMCTDCCWKGED